MVNDVSANKILVWAAVAAANHKLPKYAESILNVLPQIIPDKKDIAHLEFIILYGLNRKNDAVKALEDFMASYAELSRAVDRLLAKTEEERP